VIGPALNRNPTSESFTIAEQMASGRMRFGAELQALGHWCS
jgi:hypothetical protein